MADVRFNRSMLKAARHYCRMTLAEAKKATGLDIVAFERGTKIPTTLQVRQLSLAFGFPPGHFYRLGWYEQQPSFCNPRH